MTPVDFDKSEDPTADSAPKCPSCRQAAGFVALLLLNTAIYYLYWYSQLSGHDVIAIHASQQNPTIPSRTTIPTSSPSTIATTPTSAPTTASVFEQELLADKAAAEISHRLMSDGVINALHPAWALKCYDKAHLKDDPDKYMRVPSDPQVKSPTLSPDEIPYIYVVPTLEAGCPSWFMANMANAKFVQHRASGPDGQLVDNNPNPDRVILVEGDFPKCAEWCHANNVTHLSLPLAHYWELMAKNFAPNFGVSVLLEAT